MNTTSAILLAGCLAAGALAAEPRCSAILGDVGRPADVERIRARLAVLMAPANPDPADQPGTIEVVTHLDLDKPEGFAAADALAALATENGLRLCLRVVPVVHGAWTNAVLRDTRNDPWSDVASNSTSLFDPAYQAACRDYIARIAARYAGDPAVVGIGIGLGPSGEPQYPIAKTALGDFSAPALEDWRRWTAAIGQPRQDWPRLQRMLAQDTRIGCDGDFTLWAWWRARRLADLLGDMSASVHRIAPRLETSCFSYLDLSAAAGYAPGFMAGSGMSWVYTSISLDHGHYGVRGGDRSRPVTEATSGLRCAAEFDLISAYTDPTHMETYARYLAMMGGEARPFLPTWWSAGKTGGWAEGFWTPYSDDLARAMCRAANRSLALRAGTVADVLVVSPTITALGAMGTLGPWTSSEYKAAHTDVVRHLQALGANFDVGAEEGVTAAILDRYRLVVVVSPALLPNLRAALTATRAEVLALGWAGMATAPGPGDSTAAHSWLNAVASWWPTRGSVVRRPLALHFTGHALAGALAGTTHAYANPEPPVAYVSGLEGEAIAHDDQGAAVAVVRELAPGRRLYHLGFPLRQRASGEVLDDAGVRVLLGGILARSGCTVYPDLGPLRLYENAHWLLVENPAGTAGTPAKPAGDFAGALTPRTRHRPEAANLDANGDLVLRIPAGASVVIPLTGAAR